MLSICIPVFNFNVAPLVNSLVKEIEKINLPIEIIVADDASTDNTTLKQNEKVSKLKYVTYLTLHKNLGRSKIRNFLALNARYQRMLFLDCDVKVRSRNFLKKYLNEIDADSVICGGLLYDKNKVSEDKILHWKNGTQRESIDLTTRLSQPYKTFLSSNFLIPKTVFRKIPFDETIADYGHEDTVMGLNLLKNEIEIKHIENEVIHLGIEKNEVFLSKLESSILNLKKLEKSYGDKKLLNVSINLLTWKNKLNFFPINFILSRKFILNMLRSSLINSKDPNLKILDLYKLAFYFSN